MTTAEEKLADLLSDPVAYSIEARARARAAATRDVGRAIARKQAGAKQSDRPKRAR